MNINIKDFLNFCKANSSNSQLNQDLLVLFLLGKNPGYFVEFGACDGLHLSNTLLLEKKYYWDGLLVEPSRYYNKNLNKNRNCKIENLCISNKSNQKVMFSEVKHSEFLSGISKYAFNDMFSLQRKQNETTYEVDTISLNDVLDKYNAPNIIDYISIDTEGSELSILEAYDFSREFKIITIETAYGNDVNNIKIHRLLSSKGYINIFPEISKWDSWFILPKFFII